MPGTQLARCTSTNKHTPGTKTGAGAFSRSAARYARFFKVDADWLMTGRGEPRRKSIDAAVDELPMEKRQQVFDFVEFVIGRKS